MRRPPRYKRIYLKKSRVITVITGKSYRELLHQNQMHPLIGDFSAHSLRSGFMTIRSAERALAEAVGLTAVRSVQPALRYFQTGVVQHTRAANSLGDSAPEES
jgi:hypothetical protein